jgi:hypothetical protein
MFSAASSFTGPKFYQECLGPLWFDRFAKDLAIRLPQDTGDVLEIACGTGIVTRRLREHLAAGVRLVASDVSFLATPRWTSECPTTWVTPVLCETCWNAHGFGLPASRRNAFPSSGQTRDKLPRGQVRGTPRATLIEQRRVPLEKAITVVTAALTRAGGDPYNGQAQAVVVEAIAV